MPVLISFSPTAITKYKIYKSWIKILPSAVHYSKFSQLKEAMKEQQQLRQKLMEKQVISSDEDEDMGGSPEVEEQEVANTTEENKEQEEFEVSFLAAILLVDFLQVGFQCVLFYDAYFQYP